MSLRRFFDGGPAACGAREVMMAVVSRGEEMGSEAGVVGARGSEGGGEGSCVGEGGLNVRLRV